MNIFDRILKLLSISSDLFTKGATLNPLFSRLKLSIFNNVLATAAILGIFYSEYRFESIIVLVVQILIIYPLSVYFHMKRRSVQSLLVFSHLTNKPITYKEAKKEICEQRFTIFTLGWLEVFIDKYFNSKRYEENDTLPNGESHTPSIFLSIMKVFMGSVEIVLDVVENFIIPAVVIEKKGLNHAVSKMKELKDDYPELLAGGVGFEALCRAISPLVGSIQSIILLISIAMGFGITGYLPDSLISYFPAWITDNVSWFPGSFCFIPLIIAVSISEIVSSFFSHALESLQCIYYTTVYSLAIHKDKITQEVKAKMGEFLEESKKE